MTEPAAGEAASPAAPIADLLAIFRASAAGRRVREVLEAQADLGSGPGPPPVARLGAVRGSSLALLLSVLRLEEDRPVLVIAPSVGGAEDLVEALEAFRHPRVLPFPPWDLPDAGGAEPDPGTCRERIEVLRALGSGARGLAVVAPIQALLQPVPAPDALRRAVLRLARGREIPPATIARRLVACGFRRLPLVERRGDFAARGGILDIYPFEGELPIRIEFLGDRIDSLREFHPTSQRSVRAIDGREFVLLDRRALARAVHDPSAPALADYLPADARVVWREPGEIRERARRHLGQLAPPAGSPGSGPRDPDALYAALGRFPALEATQLPVLEGTLSARAGMAPVEHVRGDLERVAGAVRARIEAGGWVVAFWETEAEGRRFEDLLADRGVVSDRIRHVTGRIRRGFDLVGRALVLAGGEVLDRRTIRRAARGGVAATPLDGFLELEEGDLVVHVAHGIGRFQGIHRMVKGGRLQEFLALQYRGGVKLYVPVARSDLIQKYVGSGDRAPSVDRLGGKSWRRRKETVERAVMDLAAELLEIQARRRARPGIAFPPDEDWQRTFEASFPFEETPDQLEVSAAVKADMESPRPMDRLICGDVGYGKTEVAMRAAFKAVVGGKQVAVLVPTTVLAEQHGRTFRERMAEFPIDIETLSRFRTSREQGEILRRTWRGGVDILIGTHRILSEDVAFRDLGLVIIDEEQRFGVAHKEKLKRMREIVDILTLTATPIPRTLHMALLGIRDISALSTAPLGRTAIRTEVTTFEEGRMAEILRREIARDGQVYFVHNRIHDIDRVAGRLQKLVPEARIAVAHGRMREHELDDVMRRFVAREVDVLVSTTIIESGLDIPNVNTIVIDDADTYGLADLHQLRGRVGRYRHQAYAYFLLPVERKIHPDAERRLRAIEEFAHLGAGFQIALRDLEIRGAGNILGAQQSGHIATVGYDLYCAFLEKAVRQLRREPPPRRADVQIALDLEAYLPDEYVPSGAGKIDLYRRVARTTTEDGLQAVAGEMEDRFGPPPPPARTLLALARLRVRLAAHGVTRLDRDGPHVVLEGPGLPALAEAAGRYPLKPLADGTAVIRAPDPARTPEEALEIALTWAGAVDVALAAR